jgi:hypothetical protein
VSAIPGIVELGESSGKPEVSQNDYEAQRFPGRKNYPARLPEWRTICSKACKDL